MKVAEIQLKYNDKMSAKNWTKINKPDDIVEYMRNYMKDDLIYREMAYALYVNRALKIKGLFKVGEGGIAGTVIDQKLVLGIALKSLASGIILVHNHPSGNLTPSKSDIDLTKKINESCKVMDIQLLDHIIITEDSYTSLADEGLMN